MGLAHESGHLIGLDHSQVNLAIFNEPQGNCSINDLAVAANPGRNDSIATATPISNDRFHASLNPAADPPSGPANPDHTRSPAIQGQ